MLWPTPDDLVRCGWGCTLGPSDATFGAGFSSISTDHWRTLATDPDPQQGYVHEWLHQVEAIYRNLGLSEAELPPLHDAGAFTSARPADEPPFGRSYAEYHDGGARTWSPWYRDWMTGRLRPAGTTVDALLDGADRADPGSLDTTALTTMAERRIAGPLVSVTWLADALDDPRLRVVDCRWYLGRPGAGREAYEAGHLPEAIHLDIDTDLTRRDRPGAPPAARSSRVRRTAGGARDR